MLLVASFKMSISSLRIFSLFRMPRKRRSSVHQVKKYRWRKNPRKDEPLPDDLSAIDHASQRNPLETQDCESEDDTLDATADISVGDCLTMNHSYSVPSNKDEPILHASQRIPSETQDCESEDDTFGSTADISVGDCLTMDHSYSVPSNNEKPSLHDISFGDHSTMDYGYRAKGIEEPDFHGQKIGDQVDVETESTPIQHLAAEISSNSFISINFVIDVSVHSIQIMELYNTIPGKTNVKFCVCINSELSASIFVHRQEIRRNNPCSDGMPLSFPSAKSLELLMRRLCTFLVCFGNPDEDLQTIASVDTEITTANSTDIVAFREEDFCASKGNV